MLILAILRLELIGGVLSVLLRDLHFVLPVAADSAGSFAQDQLLLVANQASDAGLHFDEQRTGVQAAALGFLWRVDRVRPAGRRSLVLLDDIVQLRLQALE